MSEKKETLLERAKRWKPEDPVAHAKRCKKWHEQNRERVKERCREWRRKHPEYAKDWRRKNLARATAACKAWSDANREKKYEYHIRRRYGTNALAYRARVIAQASACACCCDPFDRKPDFDHDHETGQMRGLLCRRCNTAVSWAERPEIMQMVKVYLAAWKSDGR